LQAVVRVSSSGDVLTGYVSELASAVVPEQLNLEIVSAENNQTISEIAADAGRSVESVLWANGMSDPAKPLAAGTPIRVPPVDGMLHVVHDGDTVESIAARYKVDVSAITGYAPNNVQTSADLVPYRMIMVPGAKMPTRDQVVSYTVRDGDNLAAVAQLFGLHPNTVAWANNIPANNLIVPGQHLAILPTDGVMVTVQTGDTVEKLAEHWGVEPKAILEYPENGLGAGGQLRVGQQLMIPGGHPAPPPPPPPAPEPAPAQAPANAAPEVPAPPPGGGGITGRFIWPTSGVITQYFGPTSLWMEPAYQGYAHFHQGVDIANNFNMPIVAADGGTVVFAGWNNFGFGNAVAIDHGNGLVTWYCHMNQQPSVWVGEHVNQGQFLGPMGSTGASTGSHTHFAVMKDGVWVDPLRYLE
jgi:murein DD-endopeptidase MepM/ murein hydrolase activator NlpD